MDKGPSTLLRTSALAGRSLVVSWFLRAVEQADGSWLPRFGSAEFPIQPDEASALAFLVAAATALGGRHMFSFYLHRRDGSIESRPATDPLPGERLVPS
jgi:hypothetical protein